MALYSAFLPVLAALYEYILEETLLQPPQERSGKTQENLSRSLSLHSCLPLCPSPRPPLGPLPDSSILWCQKCQLLKQSLTQLVPYRVQRGADPALIQTDIKGKLEAFLADPQLSGKKAAAWPSWLGWVFSILPMISTHVISHSGF